MVEIIQKYMGTGLVMILFLLALIYLYIHEKRKPFRILLIYTPIIVLLFFFNPLFFKFFYGVVGDEIYFRICWLLPITVVIAYAIVMICDALKGKMKGCFALVAMVVVMVSGKLVYSSQLYSKAENIYHMPQAVVDICDAIEIEGREVVAAFPNELLLYVRQYSPLVCMPYGREVLLGRDNDYNELNQVMMSDEIEVEKLATLAKQYKCHYIVIPEERILLGDMSAYDYEVFERMHGYIIYKDLTMNFSLTLDM